MQSQEQSAESEKTQSKSKSSIFVCKTCKSAEVKVPRIKKEKDENEKIVAKLSATKDTHSDQKYIIKIQGKTISFGQKLASDYTISKSEERRQLYIAKHSKREEKYWELKEKQNLFTASFWSRYLLWQYPNIEEAIKFIETETNITIKYTKNSIDRQQRKLAKMVKKSPDVQDE